MAVYHQAIRLHISLHRLDRAKAERQNNLRFYRHFQQQNRHFSVYLIQLQPLMGIHYPIDANFQNAALSLLQH